MFTIPAIVIGGAYLLLKVWKEDFFIYHTKMAKEYTESLTRVDDIFPKYSANHSARTLYDILKPPVDV